LWWSDFELQLGEYTKDFSSETINSYDNQYNYFVKTLKKIFETQEKRIDFESNKSIIVNNFMKYLTSFYEYLPDTSKQIILDKMGVMQENENMSYNFITFNYTTVLDKFIEYSLEKYSKDHYSTCIPIKTPRYVKHSLQNIIHIHGTLENGLILGVDYVDQIANKQLADNKSFQPRIIKLATIKALGRNSAIEAIELIEKSNIIIAFGLSIGATDKYWWNYIINCLINNTNQQFIIFIYNDKMDSTLNLTKLVTIENTRKKLLSLLDVPLQEEYNNYRDRIHFIFEQKDMFKIENIFYSKNQNEPSFSHSNGNRYNLLHILKNITPKEFDIASQVIKKCQPKEITQFNNFLKNLPRN